MGLTNIKVTLFAVGALLVLSGCGGGGIGTSLGSLGGKIFGGGAPAVAASEDIFIENATAGTPPPAQSLTSAQPAQQALFGGLFEGLIGGRSVDPNTAIQVNKFIWSASLDVLNFLPLQSADPFTGVIVTGFGTPPGGGRAYRATVFISDSALDARSLNVSLNTRGGPASAATVRALEDAILARARQLRIGGS